MLFIEELIILLIAALTVLSAADLRGASALAEMSINTRG
jgi:hypothetical protein